MLATVFHPSHAQAAQGTNSKSGIQKSNGSQLRSIPIPRFELWTDLTSSTISLAQHIPRLLTLICRQIWSRIRWQPSVYYRPLQIWVSTSWYSFPLAARSTEYRNRIPFERPIQPTPFAPMEFINLRSKNTC